MEDGDTAVSTTPGEQGPGNGDLEEPLLSEKRETPWEYDPSANIAERRGMLCCSLCMALTCLGALFTWAYYQNEYRKTFNDAKCEYFEVDTPMQIEFYGACITGVFIILCIPTVFCLHNSSYGMIPCVFSGVGIAIGFMVMCAGSTYLEISVDCDPIRKTGPCAEKCPDVYDDIKLYFYMMGGFWAFFIMFIFCMGGIIFMEALARMEVESKRNSAADKRRY